MISVYLCDDNKILLKMYREQLLKISHENNIDISIKIFESGTQLLFHLEDSPNEADIIYLDVIMDGLNGIETAKKLREYGCRSEIIFLTSSEEYVFDSFDVDPLHYIIKDAYSDGKFGEIFLRAAELSERHKRDVFICENNCIIKQIPISSISYFEINNRTVSVYFDRSNFDFYSTMEKLESELSGKGFVRCHRSFLVSLRHIDEISKSRIKTIEGHIIPIGPAYLKGLKLAFSASLASF